MSNVSIIWRLIVLSAFLSVRYFVSGDLQKSETCYGTPKERRALAKLGNAATAEDWENMAKCVRERELNLHGQFALHISKSGGTSLCKTFKDDGCFFSNNPTSNCWIRLNKVDTSPQWARPETVKRLNLPKWTLVDEDIPVRHCEDMKVAMEKMSKSYFFMSENWLSQDGACENDFMNTIIIRNPMDRLISHYRHVFRTVDKKFKYKFLKRDPQPVFNATFMLENFDLISDNYYARSLNGKENFLLPYGLAGKRKEVLTTALEELHKFDWILIIGGDNQENESKNNDFILTRGVGLSKGLGMERVQPSNTKYLTDHDENVLLELNSLDSKIWEEAKKLHALDVLSLQLMIKHGGHIFKNHKKKESDKCCGHLCKSVEGRVDS